MVISYKTCLFSLVRDRRRQADPCAVARGRDTIGGNFDFTAAAAKAPDLKLGKLSACLVDKHVSIVEKHKILCLAVFFILIQGQCLTFVVDLTLAHAQRTSKTGRLTDHADRVVPTVSGLFRDTMSTMAVAKMEVQQGDTRLPEL